MVEQGGAHRIREIPEVRRRRTSASRCEAPVARRARTRRLRRVLGREREVERADALLHDARRGRGGVLLVTGEAGIGKTALCRFAAEHASDMEVLRARGVPSESSNTAAFQNFNMVAASMVRSVPPTARRACSNSDAASVRSPLSMHSA